MNGLRWYLLVSVAGISLALVVLTREHASPQDTKSGEDFFAKKVAPIFQQHCLKCHNDKRPRGGLNLTTRAHLTKGGETGAAVIPGQPQKSLLFKMVSGPSPRMPRRGDALSKSQIAHVKNWIRSGAVWPERLVLRAEPPSRLSALAWWSRGELKRPSIPSVKNRSWVRTPIDAFILASLEANGMSPNSEADRRTFLRRAKFDLHGLPPTLQEIEQFLNDRSPGAFERLIDHLLASPLYGERWGRHWLDVVHYADTHGFDKDKRRLWAWLFRDWIIAALNDDMPYHQFVRMQLAGDVLQPGSADGVIATGFVVAGPWDFVGHRELREGTVDKMKTRLLDRDDMVANTMATFNSVTAGCARCHDHKFDPITQKEYYQLQAVFAGVERGDRTFLDNQAQRQNVVLLKQQQAALAKRASLQNKIKSLTSPELKALGIELTRLRQELSRHQRAAGPVKSRTNGYHSLIEKNQNATKWVQVDLGKSLSIDEIRLIPARPTDFPDTPGFGFPVRFRIEISDDPKFKNAVALAERAGRDYPNPGDVAFIVRPKHQRARYVRVTASKLWPRRKDYVFALSELQVESNGRNIAANAKVTALDSIEAGRWSRRHLVDGFDSRHQLAVPSKRRHDLIHLIQEKSSQQKRLADSLIPANIRQELQRTTALLALLDQRMKDIRTAGKVYAVQPAKPRPIHVLHRGNVERKKELVGPAALSLMPGIPGALNIADADIEGNRRLALANWLTDKRNVLTWRSIVNRVWHYHFGRGIVDTPNDFGKNGARPSHPELLDWLAVEFRDNGQSFKKLHKMIMLSSAYRQASSHNAEYAKIDTSNRYLWRMNRRRLDAEAIRDSVLAVSGQLKSEMGGPGYALFRFKDDHSPVYDHADKRFINDPKTFRRTVYRFVVRSVPNPFLECLDCADPNISVPKRNVTLTALQALALLNNPFMVKQSEHFAGRLSARNIQVEKQIENAFVLAFGRPPALHESKILVAHAGRHGLANTCRLLFNTNEFIFVD